jgi:hypothetical protein
MRQNPRVRTRWPERILTALAVLYLVYVFAVSAAGRLGASVPSPRDVGASVDAVEDGKVLRLLSSGLVVDGGLPLLQVLVLAAIVALVISREGAMRWWAAALAGHILSAVIAYLLILVAAALGSGSADMTSARLDYGISAVLAASVGALLVSSFAGMRGARGGHPATSADRWIAAGCVLSLAVWIPVSIGWLDVEHVLAFLLGAGAMALLYRRDAGRGSTARRDQASRARPAKSGSAYPGSNPS